MSKSNTSTNKKGLDEKRAPSEREKNELFNEFFQSVFTCSDSKADCHARHETLLNSFHFSCSEVRDVLLSLDIDETKSLDRTGKDVLRNLA